MGLILGFKRKELNQEIGWVLFSYGGMNGFVSPPIVLKVILIIPISLRTNNLQGTQAVHQVCQSMQSHYSIHIYLE